MLTSLTSLELYDNHIKQLEGIDTLVQLTSVLGVAQRLVAFACF